MPFMELSFEQIPEIVGQLEQTAGNLQVLSRECEVCGMKIMAEAWAGRQSDACMEKEKKVLETIRSSADRIRKISDVLKENANRIYGAEMQNVRTARDRIY